MNQILTDSFGRDITYLRLSLTDRCDLRCFYCMSEHMVFLPKKDLLSLEELGNVADAFIARGVRKIRLTGGEPLVRKDFLTLVAHLSEHQKAGHLDEITITTNATQLHKYAEPLKTLGVDRINVSLDSLDPLAFNRITRGGNLTRVIEGIDAGLAAGLKLKINTVVLKNDNADDIPAMAEWAHARDMDMTLIEVMPMGDTGEDRIDQFIPLSEIRDNLERKWTLHDTAETTGGPARYVNIEQTGGRLGFISPLTKNFCAGCNRVRITCTGKLYMCLGHGAHVDLREAIRDGGAEALDAALDRAMINKPEKHDFAIKKSGITSSTTRHMSVTGG